MPEAVIVTVAPVAVLPRRASICAALRAEVTVNAPVTPSAATPEILSATAAKSAADMPAAFTAPSVALPSKLPISAVSSVAVTVRLVILSTFAIDPERASSMSVAAEVASTVTTAPASIFPRRDVTTAAVIPVPSASRATAPVMPLAAILAVPTFTATN